MFDSVALATGELPQRLDDFRRTVERLFCPMHVEVRRPERDSFRGRIENASLGRVGLVTVTNSACTIRRLATDVARVPDQVPDQGRIHIVAAQS